MDLAQIYYAPGASRAFGSVYKRARAAGMTVTQRDVRNFIENQAAHQRFMRRPNRRLFLNPTGDMSAPFQQVEADLRHVTIPWGAG